MTLLDRTYRLQTQGRSKSKIDVPGLIFRINNRTTHGVLPKKERYVPVNNNFSKNISVSSHTG